MSTRATILAILPIYLNRDHSPKELYADFHERPGRGMGAHAMMDMGPRPPSVHEVLAGTAPPSDQALTEGRMMRGIVAATLLMLGASVGVAEAVDHGNLDEGRPLRLEDAYPIAHGEISVETA